MQVPLQTNFEHPASHISQYQSLLIYCIAVVLTTTIVGYAKQCKNVFAISIHPVFLITANTKKILARI